MTKIDTENGRFKIGRQTIREASKSHSFKELTVNEILSYSSNVGTAKLALEMGDEAVYENLVDFGFGQKLGLDLPVEARGLITKPPWKDHLTANISFGHGVAVTGLQVANAYAAIANGGVLNKPYLVQKVYDYESGRVTEFGDQAIRRVLPTEVADQMKIMLSQVTGRKGTGFGARIDGFPVAGKTGTAQRVDSAKGGYKTGKYIANFAGFVPANDPQFVIYVAFDGASGEYGYDGAAVAAPLFRKIARYALQRNGTVPAYLKDKDMVMPSWSSEERSNTPLKRIPIEKILGRTAEKVVMPNLKGLAVREVLREFQGLDVRVKVSGSGATVKNFRPAEGKTLTKSSKVHIQL